MASAKPISEWMELKDLGVTELASAAHMDARIVEAIVMSRYTASPQQRNKIAQTLGVTVADIRWGHQAEVDHMYGHGPQFGRSP